MYKFGTLLVAGSLALALGGCGARDEGLPEEPGLGAASGQELGVRVVADPARIVTGEGASTTVTAYVADLDNAAVGDLPVSFSSSAGILQGVSTQTDANGAASATLVLIDDPRLQDITVSVEAGGFSGETAIGTVGTAFQVTGPTKVADGQSAEFEITLADGAGAGIGGESVSLESAAGNTITPAQAITDADGVISASVATDAGSDTITLRALDGTVVATHELEVLAEGEEPGLGAAAGGTLDVRVQSTPQRLTTGSGEQATITAFIVDLDNRAIANEAVTFRSSAGVLQNVSSETDGSGVASATLSMLDDYRTQDVVVTVTAGAFEGQAVVRSDGSAFAVEGPVKVPAGTETELVAVLETGDGSPIAGEEIAISSTAGNSVTPALATTDADGRVTLSVGTAAGSDTVRFTALEGTVTATHDIAVVTDTLVFEGVEPGARLLVGTETEIDVLWSRQGQPVAGRALRVATTLGRIIGEPTVTTGTDGRATLRVVSDVVGNTVLSVEDAVDGEPAATLEAAFFPALDVRVLSDVNRIETGGSDVATITALITDVDNQAVANQPVSFRATGGVLQGASSQTDENGVATATLKLLQDFRTQDILVTVTADEFSGEVTVSADGSELEVSGPSNLVEGASAELVVVLSAGNGEPIANEPVTFESSVGNSIFPAEGVTDADGRIDVRVSSANGDDTVRLYALDDTVSASHAFTVSTDSLAFADIDVDTELEVGQSHPVTVVWTSNGQPVVGRELRFASTAGEIVGATSIATDAAGEATVTVRSSSAGIARITVEDAVDGEPSTHADVEFVATEPATVLLNASSTRVPTQGTSTLTALVSDANGNPVKGREVVFSSADLKGGQLNPAFATSGSDGEASVTFTAGSSATELDEISLSATVEGTSITDSMRLTVVERVLNVTIGTSNEVGTSGAFGTQFEVPFVVQVADGGGTPLENAEVSLSIRPINYGRYPGNGGALNGDVQAAYGKGHMVRVDERGQINDGTDPNWSPDYWAIAPWSIGCETEDLNDNRVLDRNEDVNGNGMEDPGEDADGDGVFVPSEDVNGNGVLDPQDPASLAAVEEPGYATLVGGSLSTDKNGSGYFRMIYPASNSLWAWVEITARARALGAEAEDSFRTTLLLPAEEASDTDATPANHTSPYGVDDLDPLSGCLSDR